MFVIKTVKGKLERKVVEQQMQVAGFLRELLFMRRSLIVLSNNASYAREGIETFIDELCTNYILCFATLFVLRARYHKKIMNQHCINLHRFI